MAIEFERVADAPAIERVAQLAAVIWREHYTRIIGAEQVAYMLTRFQSPAAIAEQIAAGMRYELVLVDGIDAGYSAAESRDDAYFLSKLYVSADHRGRGIGRRLWQRVLERARSGGASRLALTVNKHNAAAIAVYERLGMQRTADIRIDIGKGFVMDDYRYELAIGNRSAR